MVQKYILTAPARVHLKSIGKYTEKQWGIEQQRKYLGQLFKRFEQIGKNPHLGRERPEILPGVRSVVEGKHVIFYKVANTRVEILAVLHGQMDLKQEMERPRRRRVRRNHGEGGREP